MVIWITGLPGAGKTTIAKKLLDTLQSQNLHANLLDGDELRGVLDNPGYDKASRQKLAYVYSGLANLIASQNTIAIVATVAMFDEIRDWNRTNIENYLEVFVKVSDDDLLKRNKNNLYSKSNKKSNVYGKDIPIELPKRPDIIIENNNNSSINMHVDTIFSTIKSEINTEKNAKEMKQA
ncbi:adenylyl-sulfate kinase [Pseudoalteromonas sp. DL2-H2.2]|uniref:adenylyl-sulfate kinase n=1 Tax=Pseudoalteromonas sp. DL2-H2.2 TaxID=2908889 RepID=UPI001F2356B1|nr:adenylyl-sulfate kinase [Pseudoalteromonas sp. DL2-H2.2]MCF2909720.1 adenylyl-sulfate kinase [Pseudoalteromonas sp. DL2-H2.2]